MRTIANPARGCGTLKRGGMYLRSDMSTDGILPPFVWLDPAIPWPEPHFRGYKRINGLAAQLALWNQVKERLPWTPAENAAYEVEYTEAMKEKYQAEFNQHRELARHIKRIALMGDPVAAAIMKGKSGAALPHWDAFDLLMWVGQDFYPTPQDFADEVVKHGLSKRLRVGEPPVIVPGITKLYLAHPKAREDGAGIFGYAYLTSAVFILPENRRVPHAVEQWEALGQVEVVNIEEPADSPLLEEEK